MKNVVGALPCGCPAMLDAIAQELVLKRILGGWQIAKPVAWGPSEFPTPPWAGRNAALRPS